MVKRFEMGIQIKVAKRTKYKMLPVFHKCCSKSQAKSFPHLCACALTFRSVAPRIIFYPRFTPWCCDALKLFSNLQRQIPVCQDCDSFSCCDIKLTIMTSYFRIGDHVMNFLISQDFYPPYIPAKIQHHLT